MNHTKKIVVGKMYKISISLSENIPASAPEGLNYHGPLARYVQLRVAHAPGMPGTFSPSPRVSDPDKHHARAVMHSGIANQQFPLKSMAGKTIPTFPAHAQPAIIRIWQEAHAVIMYCHSSTGSTSLLSFLIDAKSSSHLDITAAYLTIKHHIWCWNGPWYIHDN